MPKGTESNRNEVRRDTQPVPERAEGGYQPRAKAPVDPTKVKPPRGGTAIELPKESGAKEAK